MITYDRLWKTMKAKNVSQYKLINCYDFSNGTLDRLRKNGNVSTNTLNTLCNILKCNVEDIMEFHEDEQDEQ